MDYDYKEIDAKDAAHISSEKSSSGVMQLWPLLRPNPKSLTGDKVDYGIGLSMVNMLEPTLKWTYGEVIVNSGIGSHTPCVLLIRLSTLILIVNGLQ